MHVWRLDIWICVAFSFLLKLKLILRHTKTCASQKTQSRKTVCNRAHHRPRTTLKNNLNHLRFGVSPQTISKSKCSFSTVKHLSFSSIVVTSKLYLTEVSVVTLNSSSLCKPTCSFEKKLQVLLLI